MNQQSVSFQKLQSSSWVVLLYKETKPGPDNIWDKCDPHDFGMCNQVSK